MAPARPGQWSGPPPPEKAYIDFVLEGWRKNPEKVAVIDINSGDEVTFRQLEERVRNFAGSLQKLGVRSRSKVQFYADNCLSSLVAMQAAFFCNAIVFAFKPNKSTRYAEYKFQTEEAEIEFVITDAANYDVAVHELLADPDCRVKNVIIVAGTPKQGVPKGQVLFLHQLPKCEFVQPNDVRIREDVLLVSYTSGSTGMPKGVMHSHYSFVTGLFGMSVPPIVAIQESDRFLLLSTITYISGLMGSSGTLGFGATLILASHDIDAEVPIFVENYQATVLVIIECPMRTLMENAHRYPDSERMLSSLRLALIGGTIFPEQLRKQVKKFFGNILLMNVYGMTEAFGLVCAPRPSLDFTLDVGYLAPHFEVKILNDKGQPVEVGEPGELLWRGPQLTLGYWKRKTDDFTPDGFYATGDLVTVDDAGNISVVGRKKNFIICLDERISPEEIENVLLLHPAVMEVIVVATPHSVVQEAPTAMVVLRPDYEKLNTADELKRELKKYVASQLCDNKHLHGGVHFVASLDKTESGKYARAKIAERALELAGLKS